MIKNINLLQNPIDIEIDKETENYLLQSLANLGQRIGIKGDGLSYNNFTFSDVLNNDVSYNSDEDLGYLTYEEVEDEIHNKKLTAIFGICNKLLNNKKSIITSINVNDTLFFNNELTFDVWVNNIESYSKNSIINVSNDILTMILVGKELGYNNNEDNNSQLIYYKFDVNTNRLIYGAKSFYLYSNGISDYYVLLRIVNESTDVKNLSNRYKLYINIFNSNILHNYKTNFVNAYNYSYYNDNNGSFPFTFLRDDYIDVENLENFNELTSNNFESNSPIGIILNNTINDNNNIASIDLIFNTEKNELSYIENDTNNYESLFNIYKNEYDFESINEQLFYLNNDITYLYINMFKYYNEKIYFNNRSTLLQRLLCKIYEKICNNDYSNKNVLYIPLDFKFDYICNSNDHINIYYSNNIYVTNTNLNKVYLENFWNNNSNLVFDYTGIDKTKVYNFNICYNIKDDSIINSINIKDVYTMPYINGYDNWSINDVDTKIRATGRDAGNPNIIIILSKDKEGDYEILNTITNDTEIRKADYNKVIFNVSPALFENIYTTDIKCCTYMPEITEKNIDIFKHSVILSISNLDCLSEEDYKYNYKGSNIITLWTLVNDNDKYVFKLIKNPNENFALPIGSTVNLLNEISDETISNLNDQDILLLKAVSNILGQENLNNTFNNWLVIKNKSGNEYEDAISTFDYDNNLNAVIQYNDSVKLENNHAKTYQSKKYLNLNNNLYVTNNIYPKYKYVVERVSVESSKVISQLEAVRKNRIVNNVRINNSNIIALSNIKSYVEHEFTDKEIVEIEYQYKVTNDLIQNNKYKEYVFNSNVPCLDLKEIFVRNFNVLNKVNIMSLDQNGNLYNAYIGTPFDDANKKVLHIGTSDTNINIGSDTLIDESDRSKFKLYDELSLDFNTITLNADNVNIANSIIQKKNVSSKNYNIKHIDILDTPQINGLSGSLNESILYVNVNINIDALILKINNVDVQNDYFYALNVDYLLKKEFGIELLSNNNTDNNIYIHTNNSANPQQYILKPHIEDTLIKFNCVILNYLIDKNYIIDMDNVIYIPKQLHVMQYSEHSNDGENIKNNIHIYLNF